MPYQQGIESMGFAKVPTQEPRGLMTIGLPFSGPNAAPVPGTVGEAPLFEAPEELGISKLLGQFNQEIINSESSRKDKDWAWAKIKTLMGGRNIESIPEGYEESTFHYRRLPRVVQTAKAKMIKNVTPLHGRPWEVKKSPRSKQNLSQEESNIRVKALREEILDIHAAMGMEDLADDMCEYMCQLGTYVVYGPFQLSEPRMRWQDGLETVAEEDALKPMWKGYSPEEV